MRSELVIESPVIINLPCLMENLPGEAVFTDIIGCRDGGHNPTAFKRTQESCLCLRVYLDHASISPMYGR